MAALLPSEIARLVWGYLQKECSTAAQIFLESCPTLAEFRDAKKKGRRVLSTVNGHTLLDLLSDLSDTYCYVTQLQDDLLQDESKPELKNKSSLCEKVENLINHFKADSERNSAGALNLNEDVDDGGRSDCMEDSPDEMEGTTDQDLLTTSPVRAMIANFANKLKNSKAKMPLKKSRITGSPSMNLEATSDDSAMAAQTEMDPILKPLLNNSKLHENIADIINKQLQSKSSCDDVFRDLEETIHQVMQETEKDPTLDDIIMEICQVGSQASLPDGCSDDIRIDIPFSPPTSLNLNANSEISQPNELHTPDPRDTETLNTPSKGKKSKEKEAPSTPNNSNSEVPLKSRLRSASKIGHREDDPSQDSLQQINDEVVRSIVETVPESVNHSPAPEFEEQNTNLDDSTACRPNMETGPPPEISHEALKTPSTSEEHPVTSIYSEPVASVSVVHQENLTVEVNKLSTPIYPPIVLNPNPPMPANPISSIILVLDQNQTDPTKSVFTKKLAPIAPRINPRVVPRRFFSRNPSTKLSKPDRNIKPKPQNQSKAPNSIITLDGVVAAAPFSHSIAQDYPNVSATEDVLEPPASPDIIMPTPEHNLPRIIASQTMTSQGVLVPQAANTSMPSISPAPSGPKRNEVASSSRAVRAVSPLAVATSENSTERPIEVRKTQSTPRRKSSYVRTLDFSTPPKNTSPRRSLTSPKGIKRPGPATVRKMQIAARIVRAELFDKSPEPPKSAKGKRLSLITEEPSEQPKRPALPDPVIQSPSQVEITPDTSFESSTSAETPTTVEKETPVVKASNKRASCWDADLRAKVGPVIVSPVKKSPAKMKRHRIGGHPPPSKKRKTSSSPTKNQHDEGKPIKETSPEEPKTESNTKQKKSCRRNRTALKTLNASSPNTRAAAEKERLLESLQLSPSKPPERLPEPTFSFGDSNMRLKIFPMEILSPSDFTPDVDKSICTTVNVECEGRKFNISCTWLDLGVWDSHSGSTEKFQGGSHEMEESLESVVGNADEEDDLMTLSRVASSRAKEPCAQPSGVPKSRTRNLNESSNPQDMLRKVGVDKLLSALHGTTKE